MVNELEEEDKKLRGLTLQYVGRKKMHQMTLQLLRGFLLLLPANEHPVSTNEVEGVG